MNSPLSTVVSRTTHDNSANFANSTEVTPMFKGDPIVNALRTSNALFRRSLIHPEIRSETAVPRGRFEIVNGHKHDEGFVAYVVRKIAYISFDERGDPNDCQASGQLDVDGQIVTWAITLETPCGTLMSAQGKDPATIERKILITLPDGN